MSLSVSVGGQIPNNIASSLSDNGAGATILGTAAEDEDIERAEDRHVMLSPILICLTR